MSRGASTTQDSAGFKLLVMDSLEASTVSSLTAFEAERVICKKDDRKTYALNIL
jgi:hypothetical protein